MEHREDVRKWLHFAAGVAPALSIYLLGWGASLALAIFFTAYLQVAVDWMKRGIRLPIVAAVVRATSRRGASSVADALGFLGALVVLGLLFPLPYVLGAFAVLGVGDTVASIVGRTCGRRPLPWNLAKTWLGTVVGTLIAVPAFFAFVIVGGVLQGAGHARLEPLGPTSHTYAFLLVVGPGFLVVHALAWLAVRLGGAPAARYRPSHLFATYGVALSAAAAFLFVAPLVIAGPVLPELGGHGRAPWIILLAPVLGMLVESFVRRGDNVWTPTVTAASAYSLFALQRLVWG